MWSPITRPPDRSHSTRRAVSKPYSYRDGLGFDTTGVVASELHDDKSGAEGAIAKFHLTGELILTLYPRSDLAKDAGVPYAAPTSGEFSVGHAVANRDDVDALIDRAHAAGATVLEKPRDRPWGIYSGYFQDPDGRLWEILHNPGLDPTAS